MSLRDRPVCHIRYCHRSPASWVLAGFALLEQEGILKLGKVERFDRFLQEDLYPHNSIVEAEIDGQKIVFDLEIGYRSFLRPSLFDDQLAPVAAYFKSNCDPSRYEGMRHRDKVQPFVAGTFTATCPGNPYDRVSPSDDGWKACVSSFLHRAAYLREHDLRHMECSNHFPAYALLYWSRLYPIKTNENVARNTYTFLTEEELQNVVQEALDTQREINRRRILICAALKKEYGNLLIGGIDDNHYARRVAPELITHDERVTTRKRFIETMHTGVIGVISVGHQYCLGARFGELLASGRAILTDPLRCVLPGDCRAEQNYLVFKNPDALCEKIEYLLHNVDAVHAMEEANRRYFLQSFHPRASVLYALQTAFPTYTGFTSARP